MTEIIAKPTDHALPVTDNHASSSSAFADAYKDQTLSARTGAGLGAGTAEPQHIDLSTPISGYPGAAESINPSNKLKEPEKPSTGADDRSKSPETPSTSADNKSKEPEKPSTGADDRSKTPEQPSTGSDDKSKASGKPSTGPDASDNPNALSTVKPNDAVSPERTASANAPGLGSSEIAAVARMAGEGLLGAGKDILSAGKAFINTAEQHPLATAAAVGTTAAMAVGVALVAPEVAAGALLLGGGALAARGVYDLYESASDLKAINSTYTNPNATPEQMQAADTKAQQTLGTPILDVASGALSVYSGAAIVSSLRSAAAADLARNAVVNERASAAFRNIEVDSDMYYSGNSSFLPGTGDVAG